MASVEGREGQRGNTVSCREQQGYIHGPGVRRTRAKRKEQRKAVRAVMSDVRSGATLVAHQRDLCLSSVLQGFL